MDEMNEEPVSTNCYIYNTKTFKLFTGKQIGPKVYTTYRAAKKQLKRMITQGQLDKQWRVIGTRSFDNIEPTVEVKSLMTGQSVVLRTRDVGSCVDPSTERYWSM